MSNYSEAINAAKTIRDEVKVGANTANRVGNALLSIIGALSAEITELGSVGGIYGLHSRMDVNTIHHPLTNIIPNRVYRVVVAEDWSVEGLQGQWKWNIEEVNSDGTSSVRAGKLMTESSVSDIMFVSKADVSYRVFFRASTGEFANCTIKDVTDEIDVIPLDLFDSLKVYHFTSNQLRLHFENCPFGCFSLKSKSSTYKYRLLIGDTASYPPSKFNYQGDFLNKDESIAVKNNAVGNVVILSIMRQDEASITPDASILSEIREEVEFKSINKDLYGVQEYADTIAENTKTNMNNIKSDMNMTGIYSFHADMETTVSYPMQGILPNHIYHVRANNDWSDSGLSDVWKWYVEEINADSVSSVINGVKLGQSAISSFLFTAAQDMSYKCFFRANIGQKCHIIIEDVTDLVNTTSFNLVSSLTPYQFSGNQIRFYLNRNPFSRIRIVNNSEKYKYRILVGNTEEFMSTSFIYQGDFIGKDGSDTVDSNDFLRKVVIVSVMQNTEENIAYNQEIFDEILKDCIFTSCSLSDENFRKIKELKADKYVEFDNVVAFGETRVRAYIIGCDCNQLKIKNQSSVYEYSLLIGDSQSYPPASFVTNMQFLHEGEQAVLEIPQDHKNNVIVLNVRKKGDAGLTANERIKILDGVVIEKVYDSPTYKSIFEFVEKGTTIYQGEKIQLTPNVYEWEKYMNINPSVSPNYKQGGTTFGKYFFQMHTNGNPIAIYDLESKELVQEIPISIVSHCNSISFGIGYYDDLDPFPLLYVSDNEGTSVNVIRIVLSDGIYTASVVQTISTRLLQNRGIHVSSIAIDRMSNKMIVTGMQRKDWRISKDNHIMMCVVDIPNLDETELGEPIGEIYQYEYIYAPQGQYASYGKLYMAYGNSVKDLGVLVFDYNNGNILSKMSLGLCGGEPEGIGIYNDALYISWQGNYITKHTF